MKRLGSRRVRWVCGATALALALASFFANSVQTVHDKQKVAKMTDKMKTVCVGRFLIDLPAEAEVTIGRAAIGGIDLSSTMHESEEEFTSRLQKTEIEIKRTLNEESRVSLESVRQLSGEAAKGTLFVHNRRRSKLHRGDHVVTVENVAVHSVLRFPGLSITGNADWLDPDYVDDVVRLLGRIRPLLPNEIPKERGFCLADALVRDPYEHRSSESVVMFAGLPGHPDVNIVLSSMSGTSHAPGLLQRNAAAAAREPVFVQMAFTNLREQTRAINGLQGEELITRVREPNFTTGYSFQWEAQGEKDDVLAPLLTLELESGTNPVTGGKPVQSTLSEEAMFDLWEQIASSIRLRPTEPDKAVVPELVTIALGTAAYAGDVCPQTGWWHCGDSNPATGILGGERQFLKQGQRMPQALLLPQPTMWQRLRGVQPSYENHHPTLWTLVDKRNSARVSAPTALEQAISGNELLMIPAGDTPTAHIETPIGSVAKTGTACPASGWWRCEDSHALDGTRWFAAGSLLPAATFRAQLHGRVSGHPELIHRRSAWQLVRYAGASNHADTGHMGS
jgi:hypothetical protein